MALSNSIESYQTWLPMICGLGNKFKVLGVDGYGVEPVFVLLKSIINYLHSSEFIWRLLLADYCFTAASCSALDCTSTTFRELRPCSAKNFGVMPNWLGSIFLGYPGLRRYLHSQLWQRQGYQDWSCILNNSSGWFLLRQWDYVSIASRWNSYALTIRLRCLP